MQTRFRFALVLMRWNYFIPSRIVSLKEEFTVKPKLRLWLIILVYLGFVSIGLPDGLLGVAWPAMRASFNLPLDALGGLLVMYTAGYLIASFSSGRLLHRFTVGTLLALSCLATGVSLLGYALASEWWIVMLLAALAGLGAGAIDAGLNTYAATHFSAGMVNWLHAFYGVGALSGPLLMTNVLAAGLSWQWGYAIVAGGQLGLAACFGWTRERWNDQTPTEVDSEAATTELSATSFSTLRLPVVWVSIASFFLYTGTEAIAGAYSLLTETRKLPMMTAGMWVSIYWSGLTVGRILSALLAERISAQWLLRSCIAGQIAGAVLLWLGFSVGLALLGLACAPIFPTLIATTPNRLAKAHVANAVGFQIAAAVLGQSLLPALVGVLARNFGLELIAPSLLVASVLLFALHEALLATANRHTITIPSADVRT
jgi:fucose permease